MCPVSLKVYLRRSIEIYIYCGVIIGGACIYPGLLDGAYGAALVFYWGGGDPGATSKKKSFPSSISYYV